MRSYDLAPARRATPVRHARAASPARRWLHHLPVRVTVILDEEGLAAARGGQPLPIGSDACA
jgi:hypothetical protein